MVKRLILSKDYLLGKIYLDVSHLNYYTATDLAKFNILAISVAFYDFVLLFKVIIGFRCFNFIEYFKDCYLLCVLKGSLIKTQLLSRLGNKSTISFLNYLTKVCKSLSNLMTTSNLSQLVQFSWKHDLSRFINKWYKKLLVL